MSQNDSLHAIPEGFPTLPKYSAQWRAVRFELSPGTGEWVTSHIASRDADGFCVIQVLRPAVLRAMFGSNAKHFQSLLDFVEKALEGYLARGGELSKWEGPVEGFVATSTKTAYARRGRIEALRMAVRQSTALCTLDDLDIPIEPASIEDESRYWTGRIKDAVTEKRPDLSIYFDKYGKLYADSVRFGFLTESTGVHFANLVPTSLSHCMRNARGKLQELRTGSRTMQLSVAKLVAGFPRSDDITLTERQITASERAIVELKQEAIENDIGIEIAYSPIEAADFVLALA